MKKFTLEEVVRICKKLKCVASLVIGINGEIIGRVTLTGAKREDILVVKKELGLGDFKKSYWRNWSDIDWEVGNLVFNKVEECKIVRYEERVIPAQPERVERVPIYECKEE